MRLIGYPGDHTQFEAPPLASGRRLRSDREAEVGLGLADALGLRPGSTLAVQSGGGGDEIRLRVVGVVRALENQGRVAYTRDAPLLKAEPRLQPAIAIRLTAGADPARVAAGLRALGAAPTPVRGATTSNAGFLGILAAVLRGVGLAIGLVCLYALIQALAITARERRGAVALLRATGADQTTVALVLAGAALAVAVPAALAAAVLERVALGPLVASLAAGFASLELAPTLAQVLLVIAGRARAVGGRDGRHRAARDARADRRRAAGGVMRLALILVVLLVAGCGSQPAGPPPGSTLDATLVDRDGDGALERGPGEPLRERDELGGGGRRVATLATFAQITDAHVRDEESPARVPFLDRLGGVFSPTFRPQEALTAQVLDASVRSLNRVRPQAVVVTGDLADNAQANELDTARAVLDGGRVRPDSGAPGYTGVQEKDNPDPFYYRPDSDPPRHPGLLDAAQRAFTAHGLDAPWYPVLGNHDLLAQGEVPPTPAINALATGDRAVESLDPRLRPRPGTDSKAAVAAVLAGGLPGRTRKVPADPARRLLSPAEVLQRLGRRGRDGGRLDYTFDVGPSVRGIVLDVVNRAGGARGVVTPAQLAWLRGALRSAGRRYVVVFSHQPLTHVGRRRGRAARAGCRAERRRRDRRASPLQRDRPPRLGPLLADRDRVAGRLPAAGALLPPRPHDPRGRARDVDGRPGRHRPRRHLTRARVPRRAGRPAAGLCRASARSQRPPDAAAAIERAHGGRDHGRLRRILERARP